ncbi:MAG: sodium-dependent transporter [Acidobacteriota bacterium]
MATTSGDRGEWGSKLGFVFAAAGSAVGLGNIWKFPSEVAENGGAAFLVIYLLCCFVVGFPVMVAELSIGRRTGKNPVGAFKALGGGPFVLVGYWGILCGVAILSFYLVIAGWTFSYAFSELFHGLGQTAWSDAFAAQGSGPKNAIFTLLFALATFLVVIGGVQSGIERVTKTLMPALLVILVLMIGYVLFQPGSSEGLAVYLMPDFSKISTGLIFQAMGQAFFSLSLGMGALITYGSYLNRRQNLPEAAAYVTLADVGIAFLAGLLIMPAMYAAQANGIAIFDAQGALINSTGLVFNVLPALFHSMEGTIGLILGVTFFLLLSMAALTSTISLLEVPVAFLIDEHGMKRTQAAALITTIVGVIGAAVSFQLSLIGSLDLVFNTIGLPLGGLMICLFLAYAWKTTNAMAEMEDGFPGVRDSAFGKIWPVAVGIVSPILIAIVLTTTLINLF